MFFEHKVNQTNPKDVQNDFHLWGYFKDSLCDKVFENKPN